MGGQESRLQDAARISSSLVIPGKVRDAHCCVPHTVKVGIQKKTVRTRTLGMIMGEYKEDLQAKTTGLNHIVKSKEEKTQEQE